MLFNQLEDAHIDFFMTAFLSEKHQTDHGLYLYSNYLTDVEYNYFTRMPNKAIHQIELAIQYCQFHDRKPSFASTREDPAFKNAMHQHGFELYYRESWMTLQTVLRPNIFSSLQFSSENKDFITTFLASYQKMSDRDYYTFDAADVHLIDNLLHSTHSKKILVGYRNGKPLACGILAIKEKLAGMYCLGVLHDVRNQGIGTDMVHQLIREAKKSGASLIFLQTPADSYLENWYQTFGFSKTAILNYYSLK